MNCRKLIETYYIDLNNLVSVLNSLVNSYRLLIGGADELNKIALAKKGDVKDAIDRANNLGEVIDKIINTLDKTSISYLEYCAIKSEAVKCKLELDNINTEIDEQLKLKE